MLTMIYRGVQAKGETEAGPLTLPRSPVLEVKPSMAYSILMASPGKRVMSETVMGRGAKTRLLLQCKFPTWRLNMAGWKKIKK